MSESSDYSRRPVSEMVDPDSQLKRNECRVNAQQLIDCPIELKCMPNQCNPVSPTMEKFRKEENLWDAVYPLCLPRLGHAIIINNIQTEVAGSTIDVQALQRAYQTVGFNVKVHTNCSNKEMREIRAWIMKEENHRESNCLVVTILCHGNEHGDLLDKNKTVAWKVEFFVQDLSSVTTLVGKPKILVIQSCRGTQWSVGVPVPASAHAPAHVPANTLSADVPTQVFLPHKSDMLLAYATVPGYRAYAGDESGSLYLQRFSKYLLREYMRRPLSSIFKMVRQYMTEAVQGEEGMKQCPEERSSLRYNVMFSEYQKMSEAGPGEPETETVKIEEPSEVLDAGKLTTDRPKPPRPAPRASPRPSPRASPVPAPRKSKKKLSKDTSQGSTVLFIKPEFPSSLDEKNMSAENKPGTSPQLTRASSEKSSSSILRPLATPTPYVRVQSAPSGIGGENEQPSQDKTTSASEQTLRQEVVELSGSTFYRGPLQQTDTTASTKTLQRRKRLVLDTVSTDDTGLQYRNFTRMTTMPSSGQVIVFGKAPGCDLGFHCYAKSGEMWQKLPGWIPVSCPHNRCDDLLPVVMAGRELLAFSCHVCKMIRVCDLETREISTGFYNGRYCPSQMCQGSLGFLYAIHIPGLMRKFKLILLNCAQSMFVVGKLRQLEIKSCASIAYIPDPYRLIAISASSPVPGVHAVCCDTGELKWEFPGNAHGVLYSEPHDSLMVGQPGKIVVLRPIDGSLLQTIDLPLMGDIRDLCLYNGQLILHHVKDGHKVSYLSIN